MNRVGLVVHPNRDIDEALRVLQDWAEQNSVEVVQLEGASHEREVAPIGDVDACDLVVAIGGDGTVLAALRAAAPSGTPVLGIACGSLGALAAVSPDEAADALESYESGAWRRRDIPALDVKVDGEHAAWGLNDFVVVRRAGQQLTVDASVDGELYARMAGDGAIVATAFGSSAYSMAAGGPLLVPGCKAFVLTPLVIHGGSMPPLVLSSTRELTLDVTPGWGGFDVEIDGQTTEVDGTTFTLSLVEDRAILVGIGDPGAGIEPLRRRGLIADSPRVLARDQRERMTAD